MISHKTFSTNGGVGDKGMLRVQDEARKEAEGFIADELHEDDLVAITESAMTSTWGRCLVSVTVWYKKR